MYGGSLLRFLVIDREQKGQNKIVLRVLILSTFQKACPTHVPLHCTANRTVLGRFIVARDLGTLTTSIVGYLCKI